MSPNWKHAEKINDYVVATITYCEDGIGYHHVKTRCKLLSNLVSLTSETTESDKLLNKFFNTKNDSDVMTDYFEDTRIYFSSSENPDYYPAALKVLEEIEQRKIKDREKRIDKFNDWLYTLDIYSDDSSGNPVISVYKDGKLLAVFTRNTYGLLSGSMNVYNLKEFVRTNGFENVFAAYL